MGGAGGAGAAKERSDGAAGTLLIVHLQPRRESGGRSGWVGGEGGWEGYGREGGVQVSGRGYAREAGLSVGEGEGGVLGQFQV